MLFSELLMLPFSPQTDIIDAGAIVASLPSTPDAVARQVYADHGRKDDFQAAYGHLNIAAIEWCQIECSAARICSASVLPQFRRWFESVGRRAECFERDGWGCIDSRPSVVAQWSEHSTWAVPPVLISGELMGATGLHLVEGHTRIGLLAGLLSHRVLEAGSMHAVWLGVAGCGAKHG